MVKIAVISCMAVLLMSGCATPVAFQKEGVVVSVEDGAVPVQEGFANRILPPSKKADISKMAETNCTERYYFPKVRTLGKDKEKEPLLEVSCKADSSKYLKVHKVAMRFNDGTEVSDMLFHHSKSLKVGDTFKVDLVYGKLMQ